MGYCECLCVKLSEQLTSIVTNVVDLGERKNVLFREGCIICNGLEQV